jgi:hypothetical protein
MNKLFSFLLFISAFAPSVSYGQACAGAAVTVDILNEERISANEFTYEVWYSNTSTMGVTMTISNLQGGVIGLPAGITGTFSVVDAPPAPLNALLLTTPTVSGNILMRWTEPAVNPGPVMPLTLTKFAKFKYTRTGGTALPSGSFPLTWQATGGAALQVVAYCNGNPNSQTYASSVSNLTPLPGLVPAAAPLELTSFWGKSAERINVLSWETSTEHNVASHVVERSAGGSKWEEVGRTPGLLSSSTATQYSMDDKQPLAKAYYRLRSVDVDGRESISKTILLVRQSGAGIQAVFPSPTEGPSTVRYGSDFEQDITLRVMDLQGRVVIEKPVSVLKGSNDFPIDLSALPAGDYLLSTESNGVFSTPLQIVKI